MIKLPQSNSFVVWFIRLASVVGIGLLGYLAKLHYTGSSEGAICELGESLSCETVNTSAYSEVLGIPVALLGIAYFAFVLFLTFRKVTTNTWVFILLATTFALPTSFYLSLTEIFVIKSICVFCELSKVLMVAILAISFLLLKKENKLPDKSTVFVILGIGIFAAAQTWYLQARSLKKADYSNLAQCMTEKGAVFYGSITCAACKRQKNMFGSSFAYIKEIECNPQGPNPQPELCLEKQITATPTWIIEVEENKAKRLVGYQSAQKLAEFSGCSSALKLDKQGNP